MKITNDDNELMLLSEKDALELGNYLSIKSCNDMMSILLKTQNDFKYVDNVKTLFEVTILKLCSVGIEEQQDEQIKEEVVISKPKTNKKEIIQPKKEEKVQQTVVKEDAPSIPAWMLEESNSPAIELENDGELYQLDNDTILKLMTGGNKELRTSLGNKWSELTNLVINKKYSNIASLLRDGKPISYFDFANMYLPLPPPETQKQIADYLDEKCSSIDSIISTKKQQLEKLEEYKKSLIFEYVTGKREVSCEFSSKTSGKKEV